MDLGVLDGDFALIIFDKLAGCVLAARDPRGAESLFWGTSNFGEMLLFSNDATLLEGTCADVDAFPSGTMFCSRNGEVTGELTMLVSDDAREDEFLDDDDVDFLVGDDLAAAVARAEDGGWGNSRGDAPHARKLEPLQNSAGSSRIPRRASGRTSHSTISARTTKSRPPRERLSREPSGGTERAPASVSERAVYHHRRGGRDASRIRRRRFRAKKRERVVALL